MQQLSEYNSCVPDCSSQFLECLRNIVIIQSKEHKYLSALEVVKAKFL